MKRNLEVIIPSTHLLQESNFSVPRSVCDREPAILQDIPSDL